MEDCRDPAPSIGSQMVRKSDIGPSGMTHGHLLSYGQLLIKEAWYKLITTLSLCDLYAEQNSFIGASRSRKVNRCFSNLNLGTSSVV